MDLQDAFDAGFEAVKGYLDRELALFEKRIEALEAGCTKYAGVWQRPAAYARGTFVTHGGSMWHANEDTAGAEPGKSNAWTLAVKAGKDGRNAG